MQVSLNWLKDYLAKTDAILDPKVLADKLTMRGISVGRIARCGTSGLESVVVGRIERIDKHPNADRLQVTQVVTEPNGTPRQIVCGAKNIATGDIVPVALPGTILPGNFEIKLSTIRGVESGGMICSGKELGISDDTEGILQLPKHSQLGQSLSRLLGQQSDDTLLEFELTPNRGDCLSIMGIAREVAPLIGTQLRELKAQKFKSTPHRTSSIISVEVPDPALCPRYVARVIDSFKVLEAPDWIQARLKSVGQRCVNNIVDITNFVMLEYGAPLHAFDLRRIQSGSVRVAECTTPQGFTLLNGQIVQLEPGDILIQDGDRPIALAGIMGGLNTQVEADTTTILLEAATFNPERIRRTAKRLGLLTESSRRYEKGVDPNTVLMASERAAVLIRDAYAANVYHPPIDTLETGATERNIAVDMREVRRIMGMPNFTSDMAADTLSGLGIDSQKKSINIIQVKIPVFRTDLKESIDVIEEIARLFGFEKIPAARPMTSACFDRMNETPYTFPQRAKTALVGLGFSECIHYSFTTDANLEHFARRSSGTIRLKNPISDQFSTMRTSLLPSLIQTYAYNKNRKAPNQRLFEVASRYEASSQSDTQAKETMMAAGLLGGTLTDNSWSSKGETVNFYHIKGAVESFLRTLTNAKPSFVPAASHPAFHPNRSADIFIGALEIGTVGELHPHALEILEAPSTVAAFELNLDALQKFERSRVQYVSPSKFPGSEFDIAVLVDKTASAFDLTETIRAHSSSLVTGISVFDVFEGDKVPEGKKSIAFRLTFSSPERTLQEAEVSGLVKRVIDGLAQKHSATLRS
ncbi:MAG: phenylalanine--tRNA ligase subunit beta [Deltaproteobacteria bacterium]|nr:phenylalanine--tRNA ligase subunit beta [Deltaproteobacteria bacterium]MBI3296176.1 phenylalanine--tRNA ligase subunit beta [Deltaproteobacteria bacterium]